MGLEAGIPAERPGSVPGRSSCAPMHHSPTRSLCTTTTERQGLRGADLLAISGCHLNARVCVVEAKAEVIAKCKGSHRIRKNVVAGVRQAAWRVRHCIRNLAVWREAGAGDSPGVEALVGDGDVRCEDRHRHQLPAPGRVSGALPLVLERISVGVGVVEIPALFALGGIGGIAAGGGGHWSSQHTDHHTQGTQHQHYSTHLLLLPVLEGSGRPLPFLSYAFTRWSLGYVTKAAYSCLRGVYVRQGTKHLRALRKAPNFLELRKSEVQDFREHSSVRLGDKGVI